MKKELKRFILDTAVFTDPVYDEDITDGVRDVLSKQPLSNLIDATGGVEDMESVKVSLSYVTKRGNRKNPTRYFFFRNLPEEEGLMEGFVRGYIKKLYSQKAKQEPYRAVSDLEIISIERYATVRL